MVSFFNFRKSSIQTIPELTDIPLPVFREVLKGQFLKNAHLQDVRIIDRKVEGFLSIKQSNNNNFSTEARQHLVSLKWAIFIM